MAAARGLKENLTSWHSTRRSILYIYIYGRSFIYINLQEPFDVYHASLLSHSACGQQLCILLKSRTDRILANDRIGRAGPIITAASVAGALYQCRNVGTE
jgi:hypothetical protein